MAVPTRLWSKVNSRTGTPTNSIWLCTLCALILASPALKSTTAYVAVTSIAVIGLYIAYVTPVLLRRLNPDFRVGEWNLGRWSAVIGWVAVGWVVFIVILFMLPPASPITVNNFNYAPIAVLVVLVYLMMATRTVSLGLLARRARGSNAVPAVTTEACLRKVLRDVVRFIGFRQFFGPRRVFRPR